VPARYSMMFNAEDSQVQWYYHSVRTEANFYESCYLRDQLTALAAKEPKSSEDIQTAKKLYGRWKQILLDERENAAAALPIAQSDVRLDFYHRFDHSFSHMTDMIKAKIYLLEYDINEFLPSFSKRCGIEP